MPMHQNLGHIDHRANPFARGSARYIRTPGPIQPVRLIDGSDDAASPNAAIRSPAPPGHRVAASQPGEPVEMGVDHVVQVL
jgi:hypothetical protein